MKRHNSKATPLLVGHKIDNNRIAVWCPYCKKHHYHGWEEELKPSDVTYRLAHCTNKESPFKDIGYYIGIEPKP